MDFKNIHIGKLINQLVAVRDRNIPHLYFLNCTVNGMENVESQNLNTDILLRWSTLLNYDFLGFIPNI